MAFRNFPGKDKAWLKATLSNVVDEIASGKRLVSWGDGSASATKASFGNLHPERLRDMLLADLHDEDPETYPASMLPVKATSARLLD